MRYFFVWVLMAYLLTSRCVLGADAMAMPDASAMNSRLKLEQFLDNTKVHIKTWTNKGGLQHTRLSWGASEPDITPLDDKFRITFEHYENEGKPEYGIEVYIHKAFTKKQPNGFEEYLFLLDYVKKKYPDKFEFDYNKATFYIELSSSDSFANVLFPFYDKSENWPNTTEPQSMLSFYSHHKLLHENLLHELSDFEYVQQVFNWMEHNNVKPKECVAPQRVYFGFDELVEKEQVIHARSLDTKLKQKKATYPNMNIILLLECSEK